MTCRCFERRCSASRPSLLQSRSVRVLKNDPRFHSNSSQLGEPLGESRGIGTAKIPTAGMRWRALAAETRLSNSAMIGGSAEAIRVEMHGLGISLGAWQSLAMLASETMIGYRLGWKWPNRSYYKPSLSANITLGVGLRCDRFERRFGFHSI